MSKGQATRKDIVAAGLESAWKVGLEGVSLGVLASAIQMSKSGLFAHFKSKEALQQAVLEEAIARFTDEVLRPALKKPRGKARLIALFQRNLLWVKRRGCILSALTYEYDDRHGPLRDRLAESERTWLATIARVAQGAVEMGELPAQADLKQLAFEWVGILNAYHSARRLIADPAAERRAKTAFAALIER